MTAPVPPSPDWEPTKWLPLLWQTVTTAIAIVAFFRTWKSPLPLAWVEQRTRTSAGAGLTLKVHNTTDKPVRLNHLRAKNSKLGPAPNEMGIMFDQLPIEQEVAPDGTFELKFSIPLAESNSPTKERIILSVSTMRWIARNRTMTMPIIIPAYRDKSKSDIVASISKFSRMK